MLSTVDALAGCLERPGGCAVVPGLPADQYKLTLGTSILGGLVAGYASRLQPDGVLLQPGLTTPCRAHPFARGPSVPLCTGGRTLCLFP